MNWNALLIHAGFPSHATTVVPVEGVGDVTVTTVDFQSPEYDEMSGFESVATLPNGKQWGNGPDNGETPAELHAMMCDPAYLADTAARIPGLLD